VFFMMLFSVVEQTPGRPGPCSTAVPACAATGLCCAFAKLREAALFKGPWAAS
jgi:hypothetical protein